MPLHGKIVVIKRSGKDGTEFPLTATCLFGRQPHCDIRIQLPQVSKEHCRIDLNENKEVILTNLSSVTPTCVNGDALQQSERLKHGDVITIIDRSFRFEYPPAPTPKKRSSIGGKAETLKILQDQQVGDSGIVETEEKKISEISTDPHLKDGANHNNIQRSLEKAVEVESLQSKPSSPFNDLYQMIKKSLDVKTPRKSAASLLQTPSPKLCTPKPVSLRKNDGKPAATEDKSTPEKGKADVSASGTPESAKRPRRSSKVPSAEVSGPRAEEAEAAGEVIEHISAQTPKSPVRRRSKEATPAVTKEQEEQAIATPKTEHLRKASPRNSAKAEKVSKKRKGGELGTDLPTSKMKRKRVSFGGILSPELFDKRLPPDSPLRKGATPRRSLSLLKAKQSLLRRASVIGLLNEFEQEGTPSPKKSPGAKKSPKSKSASPKAASPAKKSPKSRSSSPKAASPAEKTPKSKSLSPAQGKSPSTNKVETPKANKQPKTQRKTATPAKIPLNSGLRTPTVQGRFSVSRISTPSPVAEADAVPEEVPSLTVTPKIPLRRASMKSTSRKTPGVAKSAVKLMHRKGGVSRASMKVLNSWADIVKFGQTKAPVAVQPTKKIPQKKIKNAVTKPQSQTPARKLKGHVSTGHADSPATIVVGRAHKREVLHPTAAAPRVVTNTAIFKKNMKMDEDLTGVSEMFKTPVNERKRRSVVNENSAAKTPAGGLGTPGIEPSVLNTPEEPGEMMVSPLTVEATVKGRRYNSDAVQRLLNGDEESSFISDIPALEATSESSEQQDTDVTTTSVTTPKQKPELTECLTGGKGIMETPRSKPEPVEDLREKIMKTPKQKAEQQECLTGVKRIMKTPRQKAESVEDIRGKLLTTPKQKLEQQECLTGVKRIFTTPKQEAEPLEDLREKLLKTPKDLEADGAEELLQTPAHMQESEDQSEVADMKTPGSSPMMCLTRIKRVMKTPKEKSAPVEDMVGVKRLMRTPREKGEPVEENFGIKRIMKSPRLRGYAPVEDFEGLKELLEEPLTDPTAQLQTDKGEDQMPVDRGVDAEKDVNEVCSEQLEVLSGGTDENKSTDAVETVLQAPESETLSDVETAACKVAEMSAAAVQKKSVRGRRAKLVESKEEEDDEEVAAETPEEPAVSAPVRARRGRKTEATAPPAARQAPRGRNAKITESRDVELTMEESVPRPSEAAPKTKRGRNAKKVSDGQAEMDQEVVTETETAPEPESERSASIHVDNKANEKAVLKPRRARKAKESVPDMHTEDVPQADLAEADVNEVCSEQLEVLSGGTDENKSTDAVETVLQATESETSPDVETPAAVPKKSVRGRRAKLVESKAAEDEEVAAETAEETVVSAPVRARRGKKTEATAPPAARQAPRGRNAKSQESTLEQPAVETQLTAEVSSEAVGDQTSQGGESAPPTEEAVVKPRRGRKPKTPARSEQNEAASAEQQPQQPVLAAVGKPRRGRKTKADTAEQNEAVEDTAVTEETMQQAQLPVRAKRGRHAKQEEEKMHSNDKTTSLNTPKSLPVQKSKRTRKSEQDPVEPREVQTTGVVPEKAEAPLAEPVTIREQAAAAAKPRRGGRKAKQDTESVTPVESTEVQEVADKPKRGRRAKQVTEEVEVTAESPEHELQAEEKTTVEPVAPVSKPSRARGVKTSGKNEISQAVPAKRARRGAASPLEDAKSTVLVSESGPAAAGPARKGRRAAEKPSAEEATNDRASPSEDLSSAVVEDAKTSKKSVKWKSDLEVSGISKVTPAKAGRGRKSKLADPESQNVSKDAKKIEEEDLSDEVAEAQPVKRARRGAKSDVTAESTSKLDPKKAEAETQPKARRGRPAKK
ncbi:proliferation marker protein Ki-67 [Embiotoca jacksoni]|uniref:proliferation marker protein Ki-67 n=1 Tax=Embiotoca jacksoni TaxID=100190 RepID=UPI0037049C81